MWANVLPSSVCIFCAFFFVCVLTRVFLVMLFSLGGVVFQHLAPCARGAVTLSWCVQGGHRHGYMHLNPTGSYSERACVALSYVLSHDSQGHFPLLGVFTPTPGTFLGSFVDASSDKQREIIPLPDLQLLKLTPEPPPLVTTSYQTSCFGRHLSTIFGGV